MRVPAAVAPAGVEPVRVGDLSVLETELFAGRAMTYESAKRADAYRGG